MRKLWEILRKFFCPHRYSDWTFLDIDAVSDKQYYLLTYVMYCHDCNKTVEEVVELPKQSYYKEERFGKLYDMDSALVKAADIELELNEQWGNRW